MFTELLIFISSDLIYISHETHLFSFFLLIAAGAVYASSLEEKPAVIPVSKVMTHDPVLAKQGDTYYLFATGHGISVMSSKDLQNWKFENRYSIKHLNGLWKP